MGMYAFKENKDSINHNMAILESMKNLSADAFEAIDYFSEILVNRKEERSQISLAMKEVSTKRVSSRITLA